MTSANTENEDLQGFARPKQDEKLDGKGSAQPTMAVDSSGGSTTLPKDPEVKPDGGYHSDGTPITPPPVRPTGGYHSDGTPETPPPPPPVPPVRPTGGYHSDVAPNKS